MMSQAKIMVVVSHDLNQLPALCDTGVWLHQGKVRMVDSMETVIEAYKQYYSAPPEQPTTVNGADALPPEEVLCTGFAPLAG
jgi:ABC-type glutathione transport system ATPase component